jgi:hypothetical protein
LDALDKLDETVLNFMEEEDKLIEKSKKKGKQKSGGNIKHLVAPENISSRELSLQNSDNETRDPGPRH